MSGVALAGVAVALAWPQAPPAVAPEEVFPVLARADAAEDALPTDVVSSAMVGDPETRLDPNSARLLAVFPRDGGIWAAVTVDGRACAVVVPRPGRVGTACVPPGDIPTEGAGVTLGGTPTVSMRLMQPGSPAPDDDMREVSPGIWVSESAFTE
ncbi:hypothetical protein [Cellulomonas oligotrophica]|uniref:Uncharacterized protein n=1 Tax=Cellulomonas oligotrophica TaxID=931536 RepID=A0A7Y9JWJ0_9CELL|nr:hypothetical protein [Cellulomonas oligotrophica]NYD84921.1 hypothetical protein [Cellulomonas oligotrophica]